MQTMVESSQRVHEAVNNLVEFMERDSATNPEPYSPQELVQRVSHGVNVGAYLAAMQSLLSTGEIEQTANWKVRLRRSTV